MESEHRASPSTAAFDGSRNFGQQVENGALSIFSMDNLQKGVKSTAYKNAPAGFLWPGDPGFPKGKTGLYPQWLNLSPRIGVAWDVSGDGRLAVAHVHAASRMTSRAPITTTSTRRRRRSATGRCCRILRDCSTIRIGRYGGDPHPIVTNADTKFVNLRLVRRRRSAHQLAACAVVERDGREAARHASGACRPAISGATRIASGDRWRSIRASSSATGPAR